MTRWVLQLKLAPEASVRDLPGAAGQHEPGSYGGGDATWDIVADVLPTVDRPGIEVVDAVALAPVASQHVSLEGPRVKRTLLLGLKPGIPDDVRTSFEHSLTGMPLHIGAIRSWSLSRVDQALSPSRWTHVWEQEYESIDGLRVDYSRSSYHWAGVDRWFDTEMPDAIVENTFTHVFYVAERPVL
ncbi:Dabb family protein [Pseudonocardia ailaonensis]